MKCFFNAHSLFLIFIIYFLSISPKAANKQRKLETNSKIIITVSEIGIQYILNPSFSQLPDKIIINGKEINEIDSKINIAKKIVRSD